MTQALRTVKDGTVIIDGIKYYPDDRNMKYDGRLDGLKLRFGIYQYGIRRSLFVSMWGTEEFYKSQITDEDWKKNCDTIMVNGVDYWSFWYPLKDVLISRWTEETDNYAKWQLGCEIANRYDDETYRELSRGLNK